MRALSTSPPALAGGKGMRIARSAEEVREGFLAGR
jgi:acetyl/propionyl-CoA carboxylase alpha subunit